MINVKKFFEVSDDLELFRDEGDVEDLERQIERVGMPCHVGENAKKQSILVESLKKELKLTEYWKDNWFDATHYFHTLAASEKTHFRKKFLKLRELNFSNMKLADAFFRL